MVLLPAVRPKVSIDKVPELHILYPSKRRVGLIRAFKGLLSTYLGAYTPPSLDSLIVPENGSTRTSFTEGSSKGDIGIRAYHEEGAGWRRCSVCSGFGAHLLDGFGTDPTSRTDSAHDVQQQLLASPEEPCLVTKCLQKLLEVRMMHIVSPQTARTLNSNGPLISLSDYGGLCSIGPVYNPFMLLKSTSPPKIINPVWGVLILGSPSKVVLASLAGEF